MEPSQWLADARETFRRLTASWSDDERSMMGPWDLSAPCQMRDYWFEPLGIHLVVVTHFHELADADVQVRLIADHGELYPVLEEELASAVWDRPTPDSWRERRTLFETSGPESYREALAPIFRWFAREIHWSTYTPRDKLRAGQVGTSGGGICLQHFYLHDPLDAIDAGETVRAEVGEEPPTAIPGAPLREPLIPGPLRTFPPQVPSDGCDGWWTHFYPPITFGPGPNRTLVQEVLGHDPDPFSRPADEFHDVTPKFFVADDSFAAIVEPSLDKAVLHLNAVGLALDLTGRPAQFLEAGDVAAFESAPNDAWNRRFKSMYAMSSAKPHATRFLSASTREPAWLPEAPPARASLQDLERLVLLADALRGSPRWDQFLLWHQAGSLHRDSAYRPAFVLSWTIIEQELKARVAADLGRRKLDPEIQGIVDSRLDRIKEVLDFLAKCDEQVEALQKELHRLMKRRNAVVHKGFATDFADSAEALDVAAKLLKPAITAVRREIPTSVEIQWPPAWLITMPEVQEIMSA